MQKYCFIDECGDPEFYGSRKKLLVGTPGFQPLLILGMIETSDRRQLQQDVIRLKKLILEDVMYRSIPSVKEKDWYFHAKNDHPEVRAEFFKMLRSCPNIRFHAVIARKDIQIFARKHNNNASEFYFDIISHLLQSNFSEQAFHHIYLAIKPKSTTEKLQSAIGQAVAQNNKKSGVEQNIQYNCTVEKSSNLPELSVVDYFLWALQRYIFRRESRFYEAIEHQVGSIVDLYDNHQIYTPQNVFRLEKTKPFF